MSRTIVGILQPVYMPWLGYFEQMAYADHFVILDDAQYTHQDWRNRNRILTRSGPIWLTVPVNKCALKTPINQVQVNNTTNWSAKHLKSIHMNYRRAEYFDTIYNDVSSILTSTWIRLLDLDLALTELFARRFIIETPVSLASSVPRDSQFYRYSGAHRTGHAGLVRNLRIIELCRHHGASLFYEGARGADYLDVELFRHFGIEVVFQDYRHAPYPQCVKGFQTHMSAIDLLMNAGPRARDFLLLSPKPVAFG